MNHISTVQLDEADFSEVVEVCFEDSDTKGLRILSAIGHITNVDYTEVINGYQRYLNRVEQLAADDASDAYESFCERDRS